ncbi:MAG: hypothetical protein ABEJ88_09050 [Halobacterium sp.]
MWAEAAGRGLATLHDETEGLVDAYGAFEVAGGDGALDGLTAPGHADWHDAAVAFVRRRRRLLADRGHGDVADAVLDYLRAHPGAFAGAGDPVVCHSWWTPEHVAVRDGAVACVVDFEHALAAPGEWDYWRTVLPAFADDGARDAFRAGYESVRALPAGVEERRPLYLVLALVYYVESLYVQAQHGPAATERRADGLRNAVFDVLGDLD